MITLAVAIALIIFFVFINLYPFRFVRSQERKLSEDVPDVYVYSYQVHLHTQFSYDSLGKPEDVVESMEREDIDYVLVTDHENDAIRHFCNDRTIAGIERKITDGKGSIMGDLLEFGSVKVIAHAFKEKYRWKLSRDKEYLLELINLKDALMDSKPKLFLFLLYMAMLYPFLKRSSLGLLKKVIDIEKYALAYLKDDWKNKAVGGLDHHVKVYIREVGIRFLFPSYRLSFSIMRNFLISGRRVKSCDDFLNTLKTELSIISFQNKPSLVWENNGKVCVQTPFENSLIFLSSGKGALCFRGSSAWADLEEGIYIVYAYTYSFKIGNLYLGLSPLFITSLEVCYGRKTPTPVDKTEDNREV
ncbi:MAG: histidinol-phosphatase [Aquificaceae bacterium]